VDIKEFMPLVRVIAIKIHRSLPSSVILDDLVQDGMVGLILAFREHNADYGVPFHAFAGNKIKWAIMEGLRAGDWADKNVRRRANNVSKAIEKLQAMLLREPTKREIAEELGVRIDDIISILGDAYGYSFVRINDGVRSESLSDEEQGETIDIPDSLLEPSVIVERREASSRAVACLKTLQLNERRAFILRVMCDMSGRQAAVEMGLSESRVSQLCKAATQKLASYVELPV
jgi:RNA polymerase sigma factor for flagellar operon FliA